MTLARRAMPRVLSVQVRSRKPHATLVIIAHAWNRLSLAVIRMRAIPVVMIAIQRAMALRTAWIVYATYTLPVTKSAPHLLMIAAELVCRFVLLEVLAPWAIVVIVAVAGVEIFMFHN